MSKPSTSPTPPLACWSCRSWSDDPSFCSHCGKILQLPSGVDYFTFFGLAQKLRIDLAELEKRFHELSWRLHPDNFVRASELEKGLSLEHASELNDAYRTLLDPIRRVEYLLQHSGMRKEGQHKQQAPPELLEEVFELNEWLDELRGARQAGDGNLPGLRAKLEVAERNFEEKLAGVDGDLDRVFGEWDAALDAGVGDEPKKRLMTKMNELLNRRSYIRNLVNNVRQELAEA